jgi:hypothetical protein
VSASRGPRPGPVIIGPSNGAGLRLRPAGSVLTASQLAAVQNLLDSSGESSVQLQLAQQPLVTPVQTPLNQTDTPGAAKPH